LIGRPYRNEYAMATTITISSCHTYCFRKFIIYRKKNNGIFI
jgi:hypothetical protein